jgi:NhaP-type Na+/H+ and K+/H+ antiporter
MNQAGHNLHFLPKSPSTMFWFAFFIVLCSIVTVLSVFDPVAIKKRQVDESHSNPMNTEQEYSKPRRKRERKVPKLSKEDQDALKAARMFFKNDGLTFAQAMGRDNVHYKDLTGELIHSEFYSLVC